MKRGTRPSCVPNAANQVRPPKSLKFWLLQLGVFLVLLSLALAMVIIGARKENQCPAEPMVPVVLTVLGSLAMVSCVFKISEALVWLLLKTEFIDIKPSSKSMKFFYLFINYFIHLVLSFIAIVWCIAGVTYVIRVYKPDFNDQESPDYCDKHAYMFALVILSILIVLASVITVIIVCLIFCSCSLLCIEGHTGKYVEEKNENDGFAL